MSFGSLPQKLLTALPLLLLATPSPGREVRGGDVIYPGSAQGPDRVMAAYLAQGQALRLMAAECGDIPATARFVAHDVNHVEDAPGYLGTTELSAPLADCEETREGKRRRSHSFLKRQLETYESWIEGRLGKPGQKPPSGSTTLPPGELRAPLLILSDADRLQIEQSLARRALGRSQERQRERQALR